eukprot:887388_1
MLLSHITCPVGCVLSYDSHPIKNQCRCRIHQQDMRCGVLCGLCQLSLCLSTMSMYLSTSVIPSFQNVTQLTRSINNELSTKANTEFDPCCGHISRALLIVS